MSRAKRFEKARPYKDVRGRTRWRMTVNGKRFEFGPGWGSKDFEARYEAALEGRNNGMIGASRIKKDSVGDVIARFYRGRIYKKWSDSTKATNRAIIEKWRAEFGDYSVRTLRKRNIESMMAAKSTAPFAADNFLKRIRQVLDVAVDADIISMNPARQVKLFNIESGGI